MTENVYGSRVLAEVAAVTGILAASMDPTTPKPPSAAVLLAGASARLVAAREAKQAASAAHQAAQLRLVEEPGPDADAACRQTRAALDDAAAALEAAGYAVASYSMRAAQEPPDDETKKANIAAVAAHEERGRQITREQQARLSELLNVEDAIEEEVRGWMQEAANLRSRTGLPLMRTVRSLRDYTPSRNRMVGGTFELLDLVTPGGGDARVKG